MIKSIAILLSAMATFTYVSAQNNSKLLEKASSLHRNYRFSEAESILDRLSGLTEGEARTRDSIMTVIRNGITMMQYSDFPILLLRTNIGRQAPYQYLPAECVGITNIPAWDGKETGSACISGGNLIVFTVTENGISTLYFSTKVNGDTWSIPEPLIDPAARPGNCIYPVFQGNILTFASDGLPGMGGYDLFRIRYDRESGKWDSPQNLGFPYSSTANDLLYFEKPQKDYTYFVSDRTSVPDSLTMFVSAYDADPVKKSISDSGTAMRISLYGYEDTADSDGEKRQETADRNSADDEYLELLGKEKKLSVEISEIFSRIDSSRKTSEKLTREEDRNLLMQKTSTDEKILMMKQMELSSLSAAKQQMELEYMMDGKPIPVQPENTEINPSSSKMRRYEGPEIKRHETESYQEIRFLEPEPEIDLSIRFLKSAEILDDSFLPKNGIYYQIQLFTVTSITNVRNLKGISPVFIEKTRTGKYIYRAGVFHTYMEASEAMKKVRTRIPGCIVAAFDSGKQIGIQEARNRETQVLKASSYQICMTMFQAGIPPEVVKAIGDICSKDIARTVEDGKTVYILGPIESENEAKRIAAALEDLAIEGINIEKIKR